MQFSTKTWTLALALAAFSGVAAAGELDNAPGNMPKGIVVRVDNTSGESVVFKADAEQVKNDTDAQSVVASLKDGDVVKPVQVSELDKDSSKEAWVCYPRGGYNGGYGRGGYYGGGYGGYYGGGYSGYPYGGGYYSYGYGNYGCNYYPYYSYGYGSYSYYYYYGYRW